MVMTQILTTLPLQYKYFFAAWESTPTNKRNLKNLTARLCICMEEKSFVASIQESSTSGAFAVGVLALQQGRSH